MDLKSAEGDRAVKIIYRNCFGFHFICCFRRSFRGRYGGQGAAATAAPSAPYLDWFLSLAAISAAAGANRHLSIISRRPSGLFDATPKPSGVVGGVQGGYNYQINWLLLGIEGDFTWSGATSSASCFPLLAPQTCTADPRWIADVVGRIGAILGPALFYVRGGPAWMHDTYTDIALPGAPPAALPGVLFTAHETVPGWTAGGGVEYLFLPNWSARLEYDYYGFRNQNVRFNGGPGNFFTEIIKQNMQTVTVGINYHFGPLFYR